MIRRGVAHYDEPSDVFLGAEADGGGRNGEMATKWDVIATPWRWEGYRGVRTDTCYA